jgi:hypothetical protein
VSAPLASPSACGSSSGPIAPGFCPADALDRIDRKESPGDLANACEETGNAGLATVEWMRMPKLKHFHRQHCLPPNRRDASVNNSFQDASGLGLKTSIAATGQSGNPCRTE